MKRKSLLFVAFTLSLGLLSGCATARGTPVSYCTVTFDSDGGTPVPSQTVKRNDYAKEPEAPTRIAQFFAEWNIKDTGTPWSFSWNRVTEDITLVALWMPNNRDGVYYSVSDAIAIGENLNLAEGEKSAPYCFRGYVVNHPDYAMSGGTYTVTLADTPDGDGVTIDATWISSSANMDSWACHGDYVMMRAPVTKRDGQYMLTTEDDTYRTEICSKGVSSFSVIGEHFSVIGDVPSSVTNGQIVGLSLAADEGYDIYSVQANGDTQLCQNGTYSILVYDDTVVEVMTAACGTHSLSAEFYISGDGEREVMERGVNYASSFGADPEDFNIIPYADGFALDESGLILGTDPGFLLFSSPSKTIESVFLILTGDAYVVNASGEEIEPTDFSEDTDGYKYGTYAINDYAFALLTDGGDENASLSYVGLQYRCHERVNATTVSWPRTEVTVITGTRFDFDAEAGPENSTSILRYEINDEPTPYFDNVTNAFYSSYEGTVSITAYADNDADWVRDSDEPSATLTLNFRKVDIPVTSISLSSSELTLYPGQTSTLTAEILPSDASVQDVTWSSDDPAVATVSGDGTVTGVKEGVACITATTADGGLQASCTVIVDSHGTAVMSYSGSTTTNMSPTSNNASSVGLDSTLFHVFSAKNGAGNEVGLNKLGQIRLYGGGSSGGTSLTVSSAKAVITDISITLSSYSPVTLSDTKVTSGDSVLTGTDGNYTVNDSDFTIQNTGTGQLRISSITIHYYLRDSAPVTDITLDSGDAIITAGETLVLTATTTPANPTAFLVWISHDTSVATVKDGVITAVAVGTANITVFGDNDGNETLDEDEPYVTITITVVSAS